MPLVLQEPPREGLMKDGTKPGRKERREPPRGHPQLAAWDVEQGLPRAFLGNVHRKPQWKRVHSSGCFPSVRAIEGSSECVCQG